jgi:CPA2 family monovalent cation:H+ antiporter-2
MTFVLNIASGLLIGRLHGFRIPEGVNAAAILVNRGEFTLILATLSVGAGLDSRLTPFAGLYVLIMAVLGPLFAANSERLGALLVRGKRVVVSASPSARNPILDEEAALVDAATSGESGETDEDTRHAIDRVIEQAMLQTDPRHNDAKQTNTKRKHD